MDTNSHNFSGKNKHQLERIYRNLMVELKSVAKNNCKCLIRFHNCTPYRIIPFWIDFRGLPIKYPVLARGVSLNIDTYSSHLWFFKIDESSKAPVKISAITEEAINSNLQISTHLKSQYVDKKILDDRCQAQNGLLNQLICSMCKYIIHKHSKMPAKVPCSHFTGEAKFSVSDLQGRSWSIYNNSYIYSCTGEDHRSEHSTQRRNIYLVEPFYNLRERCFLAIENNIRNSDIMKLNLPISLQMDYFRFITTLKKIDEFDRND